MADLETASEVHRVSIDLLREPLEYLLADHHRQRVLCDRLDELVAAEQADRGVAMELLGYLRDDLPLHVFDEERDLFPLLRERCRSDDTVDGLFAMLSHEHATDEGLCEIVVDGLQSVVDGRPVGDWGRFAAAAAAFAEMQRRHIAWENALVVPLARRSLLPEDLVDLGRRMAERRGISL